MNNLEFVAFDLETTGFSHNTDQIVEIGAVRFQSDGKVLARMEHLINPRCPIPARVTKCHGITDSMVQGQPPIEVIAPKFIKFIGNPDTVLIAHNASFDLSFLAAAFKRLGVGAPKNPTVDTVKLSKSRLKHLPNHKLETVSSHFQISNPSAHRALSDTLVLKEVFLRLLGHSPAIYDRDALFNLVSPQYCETDNTPTIKIPARLESLKEAMRLNRPISIVYNGGKQGARTRQITPIRIIENRYLLARCHIDDRNKKFLLNNIMSVE